MWTLAVLSALDIAANLAFPLPADHRVQPSTLASYFNYGRSVEGKLRYLIGSDDSNAAPIAKAGWLGEVCTKPTEPAQPGKTGITFYGMSFSNHVADQLAKLDPTFLISRYSGPGASPNHSLACFHLVEARKLDHNPIVVFGILASSLNRLPTLTGLSTTFEGPMPFTFPRYRLTADGKLVAEQPLITQPADYRDERKSQAFFQQLSRDDAFYKPVLFHEGLADRSTFLRMLRRAYAQREQREETEKLIADANGFKSNRDVGPTLIAMLQDFADGVRARGARPMVLLIQDRPQKDALYRLLGPGLDARHISYLSTHDIAPTSNPSNFIADGHFKPEVDRRIATQLRLMLKEPTTPEAN